MDHRERMERFASTDLYVVITESFCGGRPAVDVLERVLDAGVRIVQLREKEMGDRELFERALVFREMTGRAGALLIVDDRLDVALAAGADGVHLGRQDLPVAAARTLAPELIVGASSHSPEQAAETQGEGASYVNIGPVFPTSTKETAGQALGPEAVARTAPFLCIPFTVMGGIKASNVEEVLRRGARHIAVVTAVTEAPDVKAAAGRLREIIAAGRLLYTETTRP
jgi:thiamine-phosphate pyrophosphorylase